MVRHDGTKDKSFHKKLESALLFKYILTIIYMTFKCQSVVTDLDQAGSVQTD